MCFGDPAKLPESDNNPEYLLKKLKAAGTKIPEIYMACGTEDFLLEPNRAFHKFLEEQGVKHTYSEGPGIHDMKFWQEWASKFIPEMFKD
jgi:enterochelin esterase-like enzyme